MNSTSRDERNRDGSTGRIGTTRRAVLAAGGAVALTGLAGCAALDGLLDRAGEQVIGTTVSAPAAFYPGRLSSDGSISTASDHGGSNERQVFRTGGGEVRRVPATARAEGREIELEGWSTSGATKAKDLNSSRSNKPRSEWWAGPDDDDDEDDIVIAILDIELELLNHVTTAQNAVERRERVEAERALDAFINTTENTLRPELDKCGDGVCETVRANSDHRTKAVQSARDAVEEGNWTVAVRELAGVEEIVLRDVERLDDELIERNPGRPRFIDIIEYLRGEPTIGEHFTVCLPDTRLPGDRGSLAAELTPERVLAYFAASYEPDGIRAPFHDRYGNQGISYDDEGCIQLDGPISLHRDISCGNILSANLDTYRTVNREIVGYSTEGGAVVSGASASANTDGKCVFVAADGTLREARSLNGGDVQCWGQERAASNGESVLCWGQNRSAGDASVSPTLVCPVTVMPADCPCPLPGLFYVRRILHDDQVIFAGGWTLDEGALYEDSATLLFDEGPTEVASVTLEDVRSEDADDRIVEQLSRDRSEHGSAVIAGDLDDDGDGVPTALQSGEGRRGLNAVNVKVVGEQGDNSDPITILHKKRLALDAPLVHLAGAGELSDEEKRELIVPVAMDKGLR